MKELIKNLFKFTNKSCNDLISSEFFNQIPFYYKNNSIFPFNFVPLINTKCFLTPTMLDAMILTVIYDSGLLLFLIHK